MTKVLYVAVTEEERARMVLEAMRRQPLQGITPEQKDDIVLAAIQACKWVGRNAGLGLDELKEKIERLTGLEIEEYT